MAADKRRPDLAIPYAHTPRSNKGAPTTAFSNSLPVAAMFMRSKILSWCSLFTALQQYLNEPETRGEDSTPAWFGLITACAGLVTCYVDFVFGRPVPKGVVEPDAAKTVVEAATAAVTATLHKLAQ